MLSLAIAGEIYDRFPDFSEGRLAKLRANIVSRQSCAVVSRRLGLGDRLVAFAGGVGDEELARLARNRNVLSALIEAVLGALYLAYGFDRIRAAIVEAYRDQIAYALEHYVDYKTELQEELARLGRKVSYSVVSVDGPPHDRRFTCAAVIDGGEAGVGDGSSKKAAEQEAARQALEKVRSE